MLKEKLLRFWNFWPPFLFSGIKIEKTSDNFRYMRVKLKLRFYNANYVGTQFGGLLFAMTDPFYMIMLIKNLGPNYVVWDKSACISYLKPGCSDVFAEFILSQEDLSEITNTLESQGKMDWKRQVEIKDKQGTIIAIVDKVVYIRKKY